MSTTSEKLTFPGSSGEALAARLDMPAGSPRAYALFAHCFTCSKDIFAAARISEALVERGFAVMRFDFTGLGASEGEFANTNFSSNVEDLKRAADYLRENHSAPELIIGHSLGGAAVLAVAADVPEAKAVATIGAPAEADHVVHNFGAKIDEIEKTGIAEVQLAGRNFTIKKQFLDDLKAQSVEKRISKMGKALIVFHAPRDAIVGIENAAAIFQAARHPKSFISLDDADHLLSRRSDAIYVADVLSAWASRFISAEEAKSVLPFPGPEGQVSVAETRGGKFQAEVVSGAHRLMADEPVSYGGLDTGPSPYDLLSAALGACTSMTLRMYADHKKIDLDRVTVHVRHGKVHAQDCSDCEEGRDGKIDRFERELVLEGDLDEDTRKRLTEIADKCPVHKTLEHEAVVVTTLNGEV
jgi:putative redox protein